MDVDNQVKHVCLVHAMDAEDGIEDESAPRTPGEFKQARTNSRTNFTRLFNRMDSRIQQRVCRRIVKDASPEFEELFAACIDANTAYLKCNEHDPEENRHIAKWHKMMQAKGKKYEDMVKASSDFDSHKGDAPSPPSSSIAESLKSARSTHRRQAERKKLEEEFKLQEAL